MKKSDMVKAIAQRTSLTQAQAGAAFDAFSAVLTESLVKGEKVQFIGIGSFEVKTRAARKARNPRTGEAVDVGPTNYVSFSAGKTLKEAVKLPEPEPEPAPKKKSTRKKKTQA